MAELKQYAAEPMAEVPEMKELIDKKMKEMAELKPCPFCNETKRLFVEKAGGWENDFYVHCYGCSTFGPSGNDEEQAIDAWNKRSK